MTGRRAPALPKGIFLTPSGRYGMHAQPERGSRTRREITFDTLEEASRFLEAYTTAKRTRQPYPNPEAFRRPTDADAPIEVIDGMTVAELAEEYKQFLKSEMDELGYDRYHQNLQIVDQYLRDGSLGPRQVSSIKQKHAQKFRDELRDMGRAKRYAGDILNRFSLMFAYAIANGEADRNPFDGVNPGRPRKPRPAGAVPTRTPEHWSLERTREFANCLASPLFRLILAVQRLCGLRIGEALGITLGRVEWTSGVIWIDTQGGKIFKTRSEWGDGWDESTIKRQTKTLAGFRWVGIPPSLLLELRRHCQDVYGLDPIDGGFDPDAPLLVAAIGELPPRGSYLTALYNARTRLGLTPEDIGYKVKSNFFRGLFNSDFASAARSPTPSAINSWATPPQSRSRQKETPPSTAARHTTTSTRASPIPLTSITPFAPPRTSSNRFTKRSARTATS